MRLTHPSAKNLRLWLDQGAGDEVDRHVATCDRCATRLVEIADPAPDLSEALVRTLEAPADLTRRLGVRMTEVMRSREDLQIFLDLFGIPLGTVRALMNEEDG